MYKQTIAFICRNDEMLMLNREKAPTLGLWNGVGGKMEEGESEIACILREIQEETGVELQSSQIKDKGIVSWEVDGARTGGMHIFIAHVEADYQLETPIRTPEGILEWKKISWLLADQNYGVGEMIPKYLPKLFGCEGKHHHRFVMRNRKLQEYHVERIVEK